MNQVITSQTNFLGMYVQLKNNFIFCFVIILLKKKKKTTTTEPPYLPKSRKCTFIYSSFLFFIYTATVYAPQSFQMCFARAQAYATLTTDKPQ